MDGGHSCGISWGLGEAWEGCRGCWCHTFPSPLLPHHKGPVNAKGEDAVHGELTPHYPLQGSGLEVQDGRIWLPSSISLYSPRQAVLSSSDDSVKRCLEWQ